MKEIILTKDNFEQEVIKSSEPVLVDFWAEWCGPCKAQNPILEELVNEASGYKVGKVNVDENQELAEQYGVRSIPTLLIFKDGEKKEEMVGVQQKEDLKTKLEALK